MHHYHWCIPQWHPTKLCPQTLPLASQESRTDRRRPDHHRKNQQTEGNWQWYPISLYTKTQLILHFTNSSDISTYQIPYRQQIRTYPNNPIAFPSQLRTGEHIADSAQLRFHSLSPSIWFYMPSGSTPCCFTPFRIISNRLFNYFNTLVSVSPRNHSVDGLGIFRLSKYGVRAYIHLQACLLWPSDGPPCLYPCDYSLFFYFHFIYSILYILHTLTSEIQVHTLPHSTESIRDSL